MGCKHRRRQDVGLRRPGSSRSQEQGVSCLGFTWYPVLELKYRLYQQAMISFLKPVQTGFPEDSDARLVVCGHFVVGLVLAFHQPVQPTCMFPGTC